MRRQVLIAVLCGTVLFSVRGVAQQPPPATKGTLVTDLHYGESTSIIIPITNRCKATERVDISLKGFPYISKIPAFELVSAGQVKQVMGVANPPPLSSFVLGPGQAPGSINLVREDKGRLELSYAGRPNPPCLPNFDAWDVVIRLSPAPAPPPPPPPPKPEPEKLLTTDPCVQWWLTGERPARAKPELDAQCLPKVRDLAAVYLVRILAPLVALEPWRWSWLPSEAALRQMTIADLLVFKARALATLDGKSS